MNRTQNTNIMKTLSIISNFLVSVAACTLLSSCVLLASSPIHHPRHHRIPDPNTIVYNAVFHIPEKGGVYEFECADDQFYISKVLDTTMPLPRPHTHSNCCCSHPMNHFKIIEDMTYHGSFYTITCNNDDHTWVIEFAPIKTASGESNQRDVWVQMWDGSDDSDFVFLFEQGDTTIE